MLPEEQFLPFSTSPLPPGPWLVFAPHPDDETFGMGGSLLLAARRSFATSVVVLTDGGRGGEGDNLAARRREEAERAARLLGVKEILFWDEPDRELRVTEDLIEQVAHIVSRLQPASVFFPSPMEPHPDHRAAARLVWSGVARCSDFSGTLYSYDISVQGRVNLFVDITDVVREKAAAMAVYASQLAENNYIEVVQALDRSRTFTLPDSVKAAEGFFAYPPCSGEPFASQIMASVRPCWQSAAGEEPPLVSVIVRTRNRPRLLAEALQSLAQQTHPRIEVIVVNDGGEDVHSLIDQYQSLFEKIRYILFEQNRGRSVAANGGLDAATGEYIAFLDDDDLLKPGHIEQLLDKLKKNPDANVAYSSVQCIDTTGEPLPQKFERDYDPIALLAGNYIPFHAILFHRSLLNQGVRVDEQLDLYEDWDFLLQLSRLSRFVHHAECSALYRITEQSGVGVHADPAEVAIATRVLLARWRHLWTAEQVDALMDRVRQYAELKRRQEERVRQRHALEQDCARLEQQVREICVERDAQIADLAREVSERDTQIADLAREVSERDTQIAEIFSSTSWRLTSPYRFLGRQVKRICFIWRIMPMALDRGGGLWPTVVKAAAVFRRQGLTGVRQRVRRLQDNQASQLPANDYNEWVRRYDTLTDEKRRDLMNRLNELSDTPLISVVMPVYNPRPEWLFQAIDSVRNQIYPYWELCIADDASTDPAIRTILETYSAEDDRIKVVFREQNGHISAASNSALALATGKWISLLDHDDLLAEQALFRVAETINNWPEACLIYSDEDKIDSRGRRVAPYFKCDWNRDLFLSHNLITHLVVYRASLLSAVGGFREGMEGAQDYDLALRCIERINDGQIVHIPRILYHWREHPGSTAQDADAKPYAMLAGERALNEHLGRMGIAARAECFGIGYRVRYDIPDPAPMVSLVILTRNGLELIRRCVESIQSVTRYPSFEILVVDNGSDDPGTLRYLQQIDDGTRVRVVRDDRPFNFSALNNEAVKLARGDLVCLLNNDTEVITPDWLREMVSLAVQPDVGAVGARLWYPDDTLQHGGIILGIGGWAGHAHKGFSRDNPGYAGRAILLQSFSAVTGACLLVSKAKYLAVGGLNETDLQVACNDVDFCLRLRAAGYRNIWTPYAELYHHESATRGWEDTPKKQARFMREVAWMRDRWGELLDNDPAYSPNLTLESEDFSLAWPPRLDW